MNRKELFYIFIRYLILLLVGFFIGYLYRFLELITIYPVSFILGRFYEISRDGTTLIFSNGAIEIIPACVAGAAFYLLFTLNLTSEMRLKKRVFSLMFSLISLLILNIIRIVVFSIFYIENFSFFDFSHKLFWYFLSTVFVVGIWFLNVRIFNIKSIPVYTDIKNIRTMLKEE